MAAESAPAPEAAPEPMSEPVTAPEPEEPAAPVDEDATGPAGGLTLVDVRRLWPDIVEATKLRRRVAWMHLTQNSQVLGLEGRVLTLGFTNVGARDSFVGGGCDEILRQAAIDVVGADWKIDAIVDPSAQPTPTATVTKAAVPPAEPAATDSPAPQAPTEAPDWARDDQPPVAPEAAAEPEPAAPARTQDPEAIAAAREAILATRTPGEDSTGADTRKAADAAAHPDDPDADTNGLAGAELLQRTLGAEVIEEIPHT